MKNVVALTILLVSVGMISINSAHADFVAAQPANQILYCKDGRGGPGPSEAVVKFGPEQNSKYPVVIEFTNPSFPQGTQGVFIAQYDSLLQKISGEGLLAGVASNFNLMDSSNGQALLVIYANDDRRIEFGFGVDLFCQ